MNHPYKVSYVLVDDDEDDRHLMRLALEQAERPLPVIEFSDGQEMIDYLSENAASRDDQHMHWLVILDVNMPRMNGSETVKKLRQNPYWAKLPILIMSTSNDPVKAQALLEEGANGYITKPGNQQGYVDIFDQFFAPWLSVDSAQWLPTESAY